MANLPVFTTVPRDAPAKPYLPLLLPTSNHFAPHNRPVFHLVKRNRANSHKKVEPLRLAKRPISSAIPGVPELPWRLPLVVPFPARPAVLGSAWRWPRARRCPRDQIGTMPSGPAIIRGGAVLSCLAISKELSAMEWVTPQHEPIDLNCEVSSYANAEL